MEALATNQVGFRVHGPNPATDEIAAAVFADKLNNLVRALKAADKAVNHGKQFHDYTIVKLKSSTPTVILGQRPLPKFAHEFFDGQSGIAGFSSCVSAIEAGDRERTLAYGRCAHFISRLSKGTHADFSYGEVWTDPRSVVRVDPFLMERATAIINPQEAVLTIDSELSSDWFKGSAQGSFDGEIKEVDLRGSKPSVTLVLSAGGKQIECVCSQEHIEEIRVSLDRRVRISGLAIYDGKNGLPRRIEVNDITPMASMADFTKWRGSFIPFEPHDWTEDSQ